MAMMAGGPAVGENKGELSVCMPSGFPEDAEPPTQSVADIEQSPYKAAWCEAMNNELDDHKTVTRRSQNDRNVRSRDTVASAEACRCEMGVLIRDQQRWHDSVGKRKTCG